MKLEISHTVLNKIHKHGEKAYPEEGAGLLLGRANADRKVVETILELENSREVSARHNRYLLTAEDMLFGEQEAMNLDLDIVGIFHSHPDHPSSPSEFDREWAMPWFSYIITSVKNGKAHGSRSWLLSEDRTAFTEEAIIITSD